LYLWESVRMRMIVLGILMLAGGVSVDPSSLRAGEIPSQFGVNAPELSHPGQFAVGVRRLTLVQPNQVDVLAFDPAKGDAPRRDRVLAVDIWYPAKPKPGATPVVYQGAFPAEPPATPVSFSVPGVAVRDAAAAGTGFPLIVVSHGYSNDPAAMTWITENLASKGYVVAAIHHEDPPITDYAKYGEPFLRRPLDIAFVADALRTQLASEHLIDPSRLALIGYSMGGYGVLTAAGAPLDGGGLLARFIPSPLLQPYVSGGPRQEDLKVKGLRAVVAISPAGGGPGAVWGTNGLLGIQTPLLLIAGDADHTVNYATGARSFFDSVTHAQRFLLTFKGAGHSIGLSPPPMAMRTRLWDQDWFEDPVWSKERLNAIEVHFITAFLNRYVKGDEDFAAYLNVPVPESSEGNWPATVPPLGYDAYSPGTGDITVWKGFQRKHAEGLELLQAGPAA
jgi:predicted dienelactone hydrolase